MSKPHVLVKTITVRHFQQRRYYFPLKWLRFSDIVLREYEYLGRKGAPLNPGALQ